MRSLRSRGSVGGAAALLLFTLIVAAGVVVVVYAFVIKGPAAKGSLHLPNLNNLPGLVTGAGTCSPKTYPPGAEYTFERCQPSTTPIGWSRCSTVTYSVDPTNAPAGYRSDVDQAIADVARATGLHLVQVAQSGNITIAWDPTLFDPQPGTSGESGLTAYHTTTDLDGSRTSAAQIRISSHLEAGTANQVGEEPVLLHELGHAMGLDHFNGPVVMNPLDRGYSSYQPGDLAGLAALYHPTSC